MHIMFYSNGVAIWHGFPDITHIKVNNEFDGVEIFRAYPLPLPPLKPQILFQSNQW